MSAESIRDVIDGSRALGSAGLGDLVWGHASVRDPAGRGVWMKAAGWGFEEMIADRVVLVSPVGAVLEGTGKRHLEYAIHTEILGARADAHAVVHTHAPALSAFAALDVPLEAISHDAIPFVHPQVPRFTTTGALIATPELGADLAAQLGEANGILMPKHGAVTVGPDIGTAVMFAVLLERACRTALAALAAGPIQISSSVEESRFKREQIWNPEQLGAGWRYLRRHAATDVDDRRQS